MVDAAAYDRWFESPWGRYAFRIEATALLAAVGPVQGKHVLDVGCGTGRFAAAFEDAGARVVGLDHDPAMLERAAERVSGGVILADAHAIPLLDGSVDVAFAVTLLEFVADPPRAFGELVRVVQPGGRVIVGALNPTSLWGLAHRRMFREAPWVRARFPARGELLALARDRGEVQLRSILFAPGAFPGLHMVGPVFEFVGRLAPRYGAFQILSLVRR